MNRTLPCASFIFAMFLMGCGGSGGSKTPQDVKCPEGQTYDGEFCQVEQSVATSEQPVAPEVEDDARAEADESGVGSETTAEDDAQDDVGAREGESEQPSEGEGDSGPEAPQHATPVDVTMAAQAAPIVQYLASSHLPSGARPLGSPFAGQFAEGQILERKMQLTQGKCYTVVAAGLPPIADINVELFVEGEEDPVAKDETQGVQAVLGSRQKCFSPSASGPYRLVLTVARGQGVAAAQVFQK